MKINDEMSINYGSLSSILVVADSDVYIHKICHIQISDN
jgi:hypothetical protein